MYIGQHKGKFDKTYFGSGIILTPAIEKYGKKNFSVKVLEWVESVVLLNEREKGWIKFYRYEFPKDMLYNIADGGQSWERKEADIERSKKVSHWKKGHLPWNTGMKMSEEYCQKLSIAHLGQKFSEETRKKLSLAKKGKPKSEEHKKHLSEYKKKQFSDMTQEERNKRAAVARAGLVGKPNHWIGRKHTEESKQKNREKHLGKPGPRLGKKLTLKQRKRLSDSHKGIRLSEETKRKMKISRDLYLSRKKGEVV